MFGWRARIGYLCPSVFEMIAYDFYRIVPPGVGLVGVTCMIDGWQDDAYRKGLERIEECARELSRRNCDFIIHAGVPLVVSQGLGYEREVINKVETLAKVPATTSIVAGMEALRALSVRLSRSPQRVQAELRRTRSRGVPLVEHLQQGQALASL